MSARKHERGAEAEMDGGINSLARITSAEGAPRKERPFSIHPRLASPAGAAIPSCQTLGAWLPLYKPSSHRPGSRAFGGAPAVHLSPGTPPKQSRAKTDAAAETAGEERTAVGPDRLRLTLARCQRPA